MSQRRPRGARSDRRERPRVYTFLQDVVGLTLENAPSDDWAWFWPGRSKRQRLCPPRGTLLFEGSRLTQGERFGQVHSRSRSHVTTSRSRCARSWRGREVYGPVRAGMDERAVYYFYDPDATCSVLVSGDLVAQSH